MHNAAFDALGLNCVYLAFRVTPDQIENTLRGVQGLGIRGLNVTMPHKKAVISFLDKVDKTASLLESVNTIINIDDKLCGFSTDGQGALHALQENGAEIEKSKVVLLGAGGAANAIAFALASAVKELVILNRTQNKTKKLTEILPMKIRRKVVGHQLTTETLQTHLRDADILINATSVGMNPRANETLVKKELLTSSLTVMDIVYDPIKTRLAVEAEAAGAKVISGLDMLVFQGAASFEMWTGSKAPAEVMKWAALRQLAGRRKS
jgi:shikimate dehydrogenase